MEKALLNYLTRYQKGARMVKLGLYKWTIVGTREQQAEIAKKAILLGFKIGFDSASEPYKAMYVWY